MSVAWGQDRVRVVSVAASALLETAASAGNSGATSSGGMGFT